MRLVERFRTCAPVVVEPDEFYAYLDGKLSEEFVKDSSDIDRALARSTELLTPDGTRRVLHFFCHADTWQRYGRARCAQRHGSYSWMFGASTRSNRGCIFELRYLASAVPFERIVLLTDEQIRLQLPARLRWTEPSTRARVRRTPSCRVLEVTGRDRASGCSPA